MVDFTDTSITPIQTNLPAQSGVASSAPTGISNSAINNQVGVGIAETLVGAGTELFSHFRKAESNKNLAEFTSQQLRLADAVDQGRMTSDEARMRMRQNFASALKDNPSFAGELTAAHKNLISTAGLAKVIDTGTDEERRYEALVSTAVERGMVSYNAPEEEKQQAVSQLQESLLREQELARLSKELAFNQNKTAFQLSVDTAKAKKGLLEFADVQYGIVTTTLGNRLKNFQGSMQEREELLIAINEQRANLERGVSSVGNGLLKSEEKTDVLKPFKTYFDIAEKVASGQLEKEVGENMLKSLKDREQYSALQDASTRRLIALRNLAPSGVPLPTLDAQIGKRLYELWEDHSNQAPPNLTQTPVKEVEGAFNDAVANWKAAKNGTLLGTQEDAERGTINVLNNTFKGIDAYQLLTESPKQHTAAVKFLASPAAFEMLSKHKDDIDPKAYNSAVAVLQNQYHEKLFPTIQKKFRETVISPDLSSISRPRESDLNIKASDIIEPQFVAGQVSFVDAGGNTRRAEEFSGGGLLSKKGSLLNEFNRDLAPLINTAIRATAHLEGHNNYEKVWDKYKERFGLFPELSEQDRGAKELDAQVEVKKKTGQMIEKEIEFDEGRRSKVYKDSVGKDTIGVGFNLERGDAPEIISLIGADYEAIRSGEAELTDAQIDQLKSITISEAAANAEEVVPNFSELSPNRQRALVNMSFNLGRQGLKGFKKMLKAIEEEDWEEAAKQALDSKWAKQVGKRAANIAETLEKG